jgi:hypothetical protein
MLVAAGTLRHRVDFSGYVVSPGSWPWIRPDQVHQWQNPDQAEAAGRASAAAGLARLTLPAPTGPYRLGTVSLHLIDTSRPDPVAPARATTAS